MKSRFLALLAAAAVAIVSSSPWDSYNNPEVMNTGSSPFMYNINKLPTAGATPTQPWSDTYWPSCDSGIANRWYSNDPQNFNYALNTKQQLMQMSVDDLAQLSPAEKWDIFIARYDYPTVHEEWSRTSPNDPSWEGLCHGWSPASLFYTQPDAVTLTNPDGIQVPFGSSDVKALLIFFVAEYDEQTASTQFVSERCNYDLQQNPQYENTSACADMNAGTFHVVISNLIGSANTGMVGDRDRGIQVWNQPIFKFSSTVGSVSGNTVKVHTAMSYGKETEPAWRAHDTYVVTEQYDYTLTVDNSGNVIGGDHVTWDRLDFGWNVVIKDFYGFFTNLSTIYQASINQSQPLTAMKKHFHPLPALDSLQHHRLLSAHEGRFSVVNYSAKSRASWTIKPATASGIEISFDSFSTHRYHDKVKIFEMNSHGQLGALLATLHGVYPHGTTIVARSPAVYIRFNSEMDGRAKGFHANYRVLP